ncbi:MAG TPA: TIR domain-containing protein [Pyrinomonadaceae bacterium]|nr:TIR domain-containing protein [Pyrinomonadaceae bacterium]
MAVPVTERIRRLVAADKLEQAIEELLPAVRGKNEDLANDLIKCQSDLAKSQKDSRRGLITDEEASKARTRVCYAILEMLKEIEAPGPAPLPIPSNSPSVFISYNHSDSDVADRLKTALEKNGIVVRIDTAVMEAGANIQEFIESSIRDTGVTVSLVSNHSLLSAWVALESIDTFYQEKFTGKKKFIACYIDDDFFRTDFRLNATKQIDAKIDEIDKLIPEYSAAKIDTNDLNSQKTRLYKLRNNLGDILLRLKESLCLDIREDKFGEGVAKVVRAIKGND